MLLMIDNILKMYWTPESSPLWKHFLPSVLIGTIFISLYVVLGITPVKNLFPMFVVLLLSQAGFSLWARHRFGDTDPR